MGFVEIDLRQGEVAFDHIQGGMTEHFLQGVGIAAIAQVLDGEGVTEAVRMDAFDAGLDPQGLQGFVFESRG